MKIRLNEILFSLRQLKTTTHELQLHGHLDDAQAELVRTSLNIALDVYTKHFEETKQNDYYIPR